MAHEDQNFLSEIRNLLNKKLIKGDTKEYIRIKDFEVEFNPKFKLTILTSDIKSIPFDIRSNLNIYDNKIPQTDSK